MKCIILNVNTQTMWKGKAISNVILTAAKFDRDNNRNGITKTLRKAMLNIANDFKKSRALFMTENSNEVTQQEYVDFVNKFLRLRRMESETSEERFARRIAV